MSPDQPFKDHFIQEGGVCYGGKHLIADFWEVDPALLRDREIVETAFVDAVAAAGATLLHIHFHVFTEGGGLSGAAILAESHLSVHTWPERSCAAFDIFMCGTADPHRALAHLRKVFSPKRVAVALHKRLVV